VDARIGADVCADVGQQGMVLGWNKPLTGGINMTYLFEENDYNELVARGV
jgi:hypothetical protein